VVENLTFGMFSFRIPDEGRDDEAPEPISR
jgi:hypothetical protein